MPVELVAAPEAVIAELVKANRVIGKPVPFGRIGLGIVMRAGAASPDISPAPALREALLAARVVVYNRASSGQGIRQRKQSTEIRPVAIGPRLQPGWEGWRHSPIRLSGARRGRARHPRS